LIESPEEGWGRDEEVNGGLRGSPF